MDENNGVDVDQEKASSEEEKLQNEENASEEQSPDAIASDKPAADSSSPEENVSDGEAEGDAGGESTPDEGSAEVNEDEQAALLNQEDVVDESAADAAEAGGEGDAEAEQSVEAESESEPEAKSDSGAGEMLSQDEIDAALQQSGAEDSGDDQDDAGDDDGGMSQEEIDAAINDAVGGLEGDDFTSTEQQPDVKEADFQQLSSSNKDGGQRNIDLLMDVELPVSIELGKTTMDISDILALGPGSVVELEKLVGEPVDLLVNNKCVARGEVVVVEENFGLRITSLISPEERIKNLQ